MISHFRGHERLTVFFDNPNHLGAFLAVLVALLYAALLTTRNRNLIIASLAFLSIGVLSFLCFLTYSRGALVSLVSVSMLIVLWRPKEWRNHLMLCVVLAIASLLVPDYFLRGAGVASIQDPSVGNRLLIWESCIRMTSAVMPLPVDRGEFLFLYHALYQPSWVSWQIANPINTQIAMALFYGLSPLLGYLTVSFLALLISREKGCPAGTPIVCFPFLALGIAGLFSDLSVSPFLMVITVVLALGILLCLGVYVKGRIRETIRLISAATLLAGLCLVIGFCFAHASLADEFSVRVTRSEGAQAYVVTKANRPAGKPSFVLILDRASDLQGIDRDKFREALDQGVECVVIVCKDVKSLGAALRALPDFPRSINFAATGRAAEMLLASEFPSRWRADIALHLLDVDFRLVEARLGREGGRSLAMYLLYTKSSRRISAEDIAAAALTPRIRVVCDVPLERCLDELWDSAL